MTEKNILNVIDGTLRSVENNFKTFIEVLETTKNELILLENEKTQLSQDKKLLESEKLQLEEATKMLEAEKKELEFAKNKLEQETQEKEQKIGTMTEEQHRLLNEYEKVKVELSKFAKLAEEAESQELNFEKIQALLSIFRVLVEKIWQGQPHYKVLKVLHGEKEVMTREELKNTTGIGGAYILRAVQELANVNLVEHDIDSRTVTLKQRLYAKEALDKK
jgi:chromosome segregation ATPase